MLARWVVSSVATTDTLVDAETDLLWTLQSNQGFSANDCVQIEVLSPYDNVVYESFPTLGATPCTVDNQPTAECTVLSPTLFQIMFPSVVDSQTSTLLQGRTSASVFKNPYSTRRMSDVTVTHLEQCGSQALVQSTTKLPSFLPAELPKSQIQLLSSSQTLGVTDATLTVKLITTSKLQIRGRLLIKSPAWYLKEETSQQGISQDYYAESMISFDSYLETLTVDSGATLEILSQQFDQSIETLIIEYEASEQIAAQATITAEISSFQNPVDPTPQLGFQVSTADQRGFLIDQSQSNLSLDTEINVPQTLNDVQIQLLGDSNGEKIGQISTAQKIQISFSMVAPLEPFCYFELKFPETLTLGQNVQLIEGTGIFRPYEEENNLNTGQYSVDSITNTMVIEGCRLPDSLSANPYGTMAISFVQMPDYVQDLDPIYVKVYADKDLEILVVDDDKSAKIKAQDMTPGEFTAELFKPSIFYASAEDVAYTIHVRPQHGMTPDSRIVITMPELLTFNRTEGCSVVLTICDCELDPIKNILTLTNVVDTNLAGGNLLKFMILRATNPLGSRDTGPWSIRTETPVNGVFFVVDGETHPESFFALAGIIQTSLVIGNTQNSANETIYQFQIQTEHAIPRKGKLIMEFPPETPLSRDIIIKDISDYKQSGNKLTFAMDQGREALLEISIIISQVENVRSFKPSGTFYIATTDSQDYVIDRGGQDIIVSTDKMAYFRSVTFENLNKTNGAIMTTDVTMDLEYPIISGDMLHLEIPDDLAFSDNVTCTPGNSVIQNVTCSNSENVLQVKFNSVTETNGIFKFQIVGIRNPTSLRQSKPLVAFYTTDSFGFNSQTVTEAQLAQLFLKTETPATVQSFDVTQGTEEYGLEGSLTLQFETMNPISQEGVMVIEWPESVTLFENTFCQVTSYKLILRPDVCSFDLATRQLKIKNTFTEVSVFSGQILVYLSRVKNPLTNENLIPYQITTYDDADAQFAVDTLYFDPQLKCHWACQLCGQTKDYCTQCWADKLPFMHQTDSKSTCLDSCPAGWTSNGTAPPLCQRCDVSCATCQDEGLGGDVGRCLTCAEGYEYFQPVDGDSGLCLPKCSLGYFDSGLGSSTRAGVQGICDKCDSSCQSCDITAQNCTSCDLGGTLNVLYRSKCIVDCPITHLDVAGVCEECQSPCAECADAISMCTACSGEDGLKYRFGVSCLAECPDETRLNLGTNTCEGCAKGCKTCSVDDPTQCFSCKDAYILFEESCYENCPKGTIISWFGDGCRRLSDMDARLVYFPFLIVTVLLLFVSWIGHVIKPHHLILANFSIMLGAIEHLALLVQTLLSFVYGTIALSVFSVLIYLGFIGTQVAFYFLWKKEVESQDLKLKAYKENPENLRSSQVRTFFAYFVNWKFEKLLYSRFFGLKVNAFKFQSPDVVEKLMFKMTMINVGVTWTPLIILNIIGLVTHVWGTQLYIMFIEGLALAIIAIIIGIVEHYAMLRYWKTMNKLQQKSKELSSKINRKRLQMKVYTGGRKDHDERFNFLFLAAKTDELLYIFGGRHCKSDFYDTPDQEQDERKLWSWPLTRAQEKENEANDFQVDDPPKQFGITYLNNCYNDPVHPDDKERVLKPLKPGEGFNKATQKGGPFENDLLRADAALMACDTQESESVTKKKSMKKQRGRKNRYFRQIDSEDHRAGVRKSSQNSSDNEGSQKARKRILDAIKEGKEEEETDKRKQSIRARSKSPAPEPKIKVTPKPALPQAHLRNFNVIDVMGLVDRDAKGNAVVTQNEEGQFVDLNQRRVTAQGYLLDKDDDIIAAADPTVKMFTNVLSGVLPAPFSFERYNFNAFQLFGNFKSYKQEKDPQSFMRLQDKSGIMDSKSRRVNTQGLLVDQDGCLVSQKGKKLFDKKQLTSGGQLHNLYNYTGVSFSILDVMGTFRMTEQHKIIRVETRTVKGDIQCKDLSGHLVNENGYLINQEGHIVNRKGKMLFSKQELKNGEFPKIFPFSKFNMALITGTFETAPDGKPLLNQTSQKEIQDDNGVKVNQHGYLIDSKGNIVDHNGNVMFERQLLSEDGRLPSLFKNRRLFSGAHDSDADDLSNLLHQIEGDISKEETVKSRGSRGGASKQRVNISATVQVQGGRTSQAKQKKPKQKKRDRDSSYGSEMDESPSKYDSLNQRQIDTSQNKLLGNSDSMGRVNNKSSKATLNRKLQQMNMSETSSHAGSSRRQKKKKALKLVRVEQMFEADVKMAAAYGGEAQPRVRMIPKRFQTTHRERPQGQDPMRESGYSNGNMPSASKMHANKSNRSINEQSSRVQGQLQGNEYTTSVQNVGARTRTQLEAAGGQVLSGSIRPPSPSNQAFSVKDRIQLRKQLLKQHNHDDQSDLDQELAELYQQDVDKFIDGSNFEVESLSGFSGLSGGSFMSLSRHQQEQSKTKKLENDYLKKLEEQKMKHKEQQVSHMQKNLRITGMTEDDRMNSSAGQAAVGQERQLGVAETPKQQRSEEHDIL